MKKNPKKKAENHLNLLFPLRRTKLEWILENRSIPLEVTDVLQEVAEQYQYDADELNKHKFQIISELQHTGKEHIVKFLFPSGFRNDERWIDALICMEIRRYCETTSKGKKAWSAE